MVLVVVRGNDVVDARDHAGVDQVVDEVLDAFVHVLQAGSGVDQQRLARGRDDESGAALLDVGIVDPQELGPGWRGGEREDEAGEEITESGERIQDKERQFAEARSWHLDREGVPWLDSRTSAR